MPIINPNTKLRDIIARNPEVVTVLNRFDIQLGVGDLAVDDVCENYGIDREFFTTILNTFINEDYFPEATLSHFSVNKIVAYLKQTNNYYLQFQLPNIERHFALLIRTADGESNMGIIMQFFFQVKDELTHRIEHDNNHWFPYVLSLAKGERPKMGDKPHCHEKFNSEEKVSIEDKINDLINMIIMHLKGDYDRNLCQAVLISVHALKNDISQNDRIRNRILKPLTLKLMS